MATAHPKKTPPPRRTGFGHAWLIPLLMYACLAVLVLGGSALKPGYYFLLDMPWGPHLTTPKNLDLLTPLFYAVKFLSLVMPAWAVQKLILVACMAGAGLSMHRLQASFTKQRAVLYIAGLLYLLNPYVFQRVLAGQYLVLAGYALFPWLVNWAIRFAKQPTRANGLKLAALWLAYPFISVHWWYMATLVLLPPGLWWLHKQLQAKTRKTHRRALYVAVGASIGLLAVYWAMSRSQAFEHLQASDFQVFATEGSGLFGSLLNVMSLYGFWRVDLFLPRDIVASWPIYTVMLLLIGTLGCVYAYRRRGWKALYPALVLPVIIVFASGYGSPLTRPITEAAFHVVPGFMGLRETAKLVGLIAFIYALYVPYGLVALGMMFHRATGWSPRNVCAAFVGVVLLFMYPAFFGFNNQLQASAFPRGWRETNNYLVAAGRPRTLVLPWQSYLNLGFADNAYVANPATRYYDTPLVLSNKTGNSTLDKVQPDVPLDDTVTLLADPSATLREKAYAQLKAAGISYILVFKDGFVNTEAPDTSYLQDEHLTQVYNDSDTSLYRVNY